MRRRPGIVLLSFCALAPLPALARNLPPGCGPDKIKFNVTVGTIVADMPALAPGKARLIFFQILTKKGVLGAAPTTRYAVDGAWVGANKGNSFFLFDVDPGYHQVCANWQAINTTGDNVGMAQVNAAAGATYYFQTAILEVAEDDGPPGAGHVWTNIQFRFDPVSERAGQDRLLYSGLSTFTSK